MAIEDVLVRIGAEVSGITKAVDDIKGKLGELGEGAAGLMGGFGRLGEAIIAAFSITAVVAFLDKMEQLGVELARTQTMLGIGGEKVATLDIAAKAAGGTLEQLTMAMQRLALSLARSEAGSEQAKAAFNALGINVQQFIAMPIEQKLTTLFDAFSKLKDGPEKGAIAIAGLSRAGMNMVPIFNQGSSALRDFAEMATRAGTGGEANRVAIEQFTEAAHTLHLQTIELDQAWRGLGESLISVFQPALSGLYTIVTRLIEAFTQSIRDGGTFGVLMNTLALGAQAFATALAIGVNAMQTLWEVVKAAVFAMGEAFMALGRIIKDVFTFDWADIGAAFDNMTAQLQARAGITAANMTTIFKDSVAEMKAIWGNAADEHVKIEQDKQARLNIVNRAGVNERLKLIDLEYAGKVAAIDFEYGKFFYNEGAKTRALLAALEERHREELSIAGLTAAQRLVIDQKYANDRQKIMIQAAKEEEAMWNSVFTSMQSAFNSQLRGLLAGTVTWQQAFKSILGDLLISFIQFCEKAAFEWVAHELAKTAATTTGEAARTAAQAAGEAASLPVRIARFTSDITADAARVFAGIFADLAPLMGPAAAGPAAAGQATTLGQLANIPKFEVGSDFVPYTGLAVVHQGERIIPASQNSPEFGATSISVSINAVDSQSVANLLQNNKNIITQIIQRVARDNPKILAGALAGASGQRAY